MPRAFDPGIPEDDKNPLRYGADWNDPEGIIGAGATDTAGILGQVFRDFLALDELEAAFAEFVDAFASITWTSPDSVREAIAAAGGLIANIGRWMLTVFQHLTRLDLTEHSQFVADLLALFAFGELQAAWETFSFGWNALNWADPLTAIHPAWMLFVDFGWAIGGWFTQLIDNLLGIGMPGWFALDDLRAHWTTFFTAWGAINWTNPLAGIHAAWMALVDLGSNLWDWAMTVLRNITGIELPSFLEFDDLKEAWGIFTGEWGDINWLSLTAIWDALTAIGGLLRRLTHWAIAVFQNLTGIDLDGVAASFGITALVAAITTWATTLSGLNWANPIEALMGAIGAFVKLFQDLGNWLLGVLEAWLGWAVDTVGDMFSSVDNFVKKFIEYFWGETGLGGWVNTLELIGGAIGATITDALKSLYNVFEPIVSALSGIIDGSGFSRLVASILQWFIQLARDVQNFNLGDFLRSIPILGSLVPTITGAAPGTDPGLGTLGEWARDMEKMGKEAKEALDDLGQKLLGGLFPASQIGGSEPNLLSQGDFKVLETVTATDGWEWDGTLTATGTGGSVKHVSTGTSSTLYNKQSIKVTTGDQLTLSAQVRTVSYSSGPMSLILIPWVGATRYTSDSYTVTMATRSSAAASWTAITGNWTVPATVTSVTVGLVSNVNTGCTARFDDIYLKKTGGIRQNFVDSLVPAWNELWRGLANPGGSPTTDKTWADLFGAASGFRSLFNTEESRAQTLRTNMFGSPTTVGASANLGFIPDIPRSKSSDMQTIINNIWRGLFGESTENYAPSDVYTAAFYTQESVAKAKAAVEELKSKSASGDFSGVAVAVDFSTLSNQSTLPSGSWDNTNTSLGSPTGTGTLGISGGRAKWIASGGDNRQTISIHKTATNTYYQMVTGVFSTNINQNGAAVYLFGRSNSTGTTGVYAKFTAFKAELWKVSSGSATRIGVNEYGVSGGTFIFYQGNTLKLQCGAVGEEDRFKVWQDGRVVINVSDGSAPKSYKLCGIGADARTYTSGGTKQALPAEAAAFTFYDNTPAATLGSGFHIGRTKTDQSYSSNASGAAFSESVFGTTPARISEDLTWDANTNKITVSVSGWYLVTVAIKRVMTANTARNFAAAILLNGNVHAIGQQQWNFEVTVGSADARGTGSRHTAVVSLPMYIAANQYVQAGYAANTSGTLTGSETESYFSMAFLGNTKPVQPAAA